MWYILLVKFGCDAQETDICDAYCDHKDAIEAFSKYAERASNGQWFEVLTLDSYPFPDEEGLNAYCQQVHHTRVTNTLPF